jgi:hypothetical protein
VLNRGMEEDILAPLRRWHEGLAIAKVRARAPGGGTPREGGRDTVREGGGHRARGEGTAGEGGGTVREGGGDTVRGGGGHRARGQGQ